MLWRAPLYLKTILSQMICSIPPSPLHLEICKGLSVPHHYTTEGVDFRSPPADKARKNARLFGRCVCLTVIGCQTAGWPVWASARFPEVKVRIQFCLRQNSGIPFS